MKKVLPLHSKARLFGTLNRNDIKIRISIFFTWGNDGGGKLGPYETKEWERWKTFFLFHSFSSVSIFLLASTLFFGPGKLSNFVVFPRPKWISFSEPGIKFKWKLDGIPGEETWLWRIWIAIGGVRGDWSEIDDIVYARKWGSFSKGFGIFVANVSMLCSAGRFVRQPEHTLPSLIYSYISFASVCSVPKIIVKFKIPK